MAFHILCKATFKLESHSNWKYWKFFYGIKEMFETSPHLVLVDSELAVTDFPDLGVNERRRNCFLLDEGDFVLGCTLCNFFAGLLFGGLFVLQSYTFSCRGPQTCAVQML